MVTSIYDRVDLPYLYDANGNILMANPMYRGAAAPQTSGYPAMPAAGASHGYGVPLQSAPSGTVPHAQHAGPASQVHSQHQAYDDRYNAAPQPSSGPSYPGYRTATIFPQGPVPNGPVLSGFSGPSSGSTGYATQTRFPQGFAGSGTAHSNATPFGHNGPATGTAQTHSFNAPPKQKAARSLRDPEGLYAKLGLQPTAPIDDINKAGRRLKAQYHPDSAGNRRASPEKRAELEAMFTEVNHAHTVLSDLARKECYDCGGGSTDHDFRHFIPIRR
ncbi:hypothetical protein M011DRAFT_527736 [Sporormia fimetaria CBS 119925]|uniref:J domain-containing protein n=1 Tax=Sporormia fimetaria CBS 119925 TaxID=1340428 RepID=A0A6A6V7S9_9PLEO|nr:hypothetical protein M011DRAFT_527736 [Sporormia fimetaria CBS 119925]